MNMIASVARVPREPATATRVLMAAALALAATLATPMAALAQHTQHPSKSAGASKNIVQIAADAGSFTTLVTAVEAADLAGVLQGDGPFTVFAPTDVAFEKLPNGALRALLGDKEALASVLTYHVVAGRITAADIVAKHGARPQTVNGQRLAILVRDGKVYVNNARVVTADVQASNGVIHIIDTVLLPKTASAPGGR